MGVLLNPFRFGGGLPGDGVERTATIVKDTTSGSSLGSVSWQATFNVDVWLTKITYPVFEAGTYAFHLAVNSSDFITNPLPAALGSVVMGAGGDAVFTLPTPVLITAGTTKRPTVVFNTAHRIFYRDGPTHTPTGTGAAYMTSWTAARWPYTATNPNSETVPGALTFTLA